MTIISIHSLRMEGDITDGIKRIFHPIFQSTPSAWRETIDALPQIIQALISIHSLRMEGDVSVE